MKCSWIGRSRFKRFARSSGPATPAAERFVGLLTEENSERPRAVHDMVSEQPNFFIPPTPVSGAAERDS